MELFWNTTQKELAESYTDDQPVPEVCLVQGDYETVTVAIMEETGVASAPFSIASLPAGGTLKYGAKVNPDDETYCFLASSFVASGAGSAERHAQDVDLDTAEIAAALGGEAFVILFGELAVISAAGRHLWTTAVRLKLRKKVVSP